MNRTAPWTVSRVLQTLYGVYAVAAFVLIAFTAFLLVLLPLGMAARRRIARSSARLYFRVVGIRIAITGMLELPAGACVVVANHASYIDGIVLEAVLPPRFCFVIKKEVTRVPVVGRLLRRIGCEFVDRFNRHAGGMDARRLIKVADAGQALAFFPEGTFLGHPGVGKFHSGAFAIAARSGLSVAPIAIRGTRAILPAHHILLRPGRIDIQVLPAVGPFSSVHPSEAMATLRNQARARIVAALGEPDLSDSDGVAALDAARKA